MIGADHDQPALAAARRPIRDRVSQPAQVPVHPGDLVDVLLARRAVRVSDDVELAEVHERRVRLVGAQVVGGKAGDLLVGHVVAEAVAVAETVRSGTSLTISSASGGQSTAANVSSSGRTRSSRVSQLGYRSIWLPSNVLSVMPCRSGQVRVRIVAQPGPDTVEAIGSA